MGRYRPIRIAVVLFVLLCIVLLPWWVATGVVFVASLRYQLFVEALIVGFVYDVWFGGSGAYLGIITTGAIVLLAELLAQVVGVVRSR